MLGILGGKAAGFKDHRLIRVAAIAASQLIDCLHCISSIQLIIKYFKLRFTLRSLSSSMTLSFNVKENRKCDSSLQGPCLAQNFEDESRSPNKSSKNHLKENSESFSFFFFIRCVLSTAQKRD